MREFKRMRESGSEEKKEERAVFVERKKKSYGECEEVREMKTMKKMKKKKKKRLVTIGENEKAGTLLMAKLRVV